MPTAVRSGVSGPTYMYDDRGWRYRVCCRFYAHPRPKVPGGRGLEVDDLSDVLSAPARRR
ncbi:hypothetical protein [Microbispora bryophytorum]|uniref:hypothetical protein n=1 Tax=Microbispora bryophytorum TaxID=1460882 RepID=UPI00340D95EF